MRQSMLSITALILASAMASPLLLAQDTGIGVDMQFGNELDPASGARFRHCDERGMSWLRAEPLRTPSGALYACPHERVLAGDGKWQHLGIVAFGWLLHNGDTDNADYQRYSAWDDGFLLGFFQLDMVRAEDGSYVEVRGSRLNADNQYIKASIGRAGHFRIDAFARSQPNVVAGAARSIWDNLDSPRLSLVQGLQPAASTPAQVAAASAAAPERRLQVVRDKQGMGLNWLFSRRWSAFFNVSNEQRKGNRPFGGAFFFNYPFPDNGGIFETPRPIEDSTVNLNSGVRYVGSRWRMDLAYSGSFYRSRHTGWSYENPFALWPVVPDAVSMPLTHGSFANDPDNDYHNLRASFTRKIPMNGEVGFVLSAGTMRQDDDLLAPIDCVGSFGIDLSPTGAPVNPFLFNCADWNSTDALSRKSADMRIDLTRADAHLVLQPTSRLTVRAHARLAREDYRNIYLAYNPLTGHYGYIAENGAQGSVVPTEMGLWDPFSLASIRTRVRSLPLDKETVEASAGADWRIGEHDTLGATYTFTGTERSNRERRQVDDHLLRLTWVNRALDRLTFRGNYSFLQRSGDAYNFDPYEFTFSSSLPGFIPDPETAMPHTVDALRKYDVASRDQHRLAFTATFQALQDMSLSATLRGDWNDYDAELGRRAYDTLGATVSWDWQPSPQTGFGAYAAWDRASVGIANINESAVAPDDPRLGGEVYAEAGRWWVDDNQRNHNAGFTFHQQLGRVRLDGGWNWMHSRGRTGYRYASPVALAWPDLAAQSGDAFPDMTYRVATFDLGLTFALGKRTSLRVFDRYERGRISDWHYSGLEQGLVIDHRVYLDAGPMNYSANLVGLMLEVRL